MRKKLLCFYLLLTFVVGCKKETEPSPSSPQQASLKVEKSNVTPYEVAIVTTENITLQSDFYKGKFNAEEIQLARQGNELFFFIPEVSAGTYKLSVTIEEKEYEVGFSVGSLPAIANAEAFVVEKIQASQLSLQEREEIKSKVQGYPGAENIDAQMDMMQTIYAEMDATLNVATAEEKEVAAKFIAANPELFSKPDLGLDYTGLGLFKPTGADNVEAIVRDLDRSIGRAVVLITVGAVTTGLVAAYAPAHFKAAAALTGGMTAALIYIVNNQLIEATGNAIERFGNLIEQDMQKPTAGTEFENNTAYAMTIGSSYRNLNKQSLNTSSSVLQSLISSMNKVETQWNKIFGRFTRWLVGNPHHIKNVTTEKSKVLTVNADYLTITNISNDKVTATVAKAAGKLQVKFSTTENTDQNFDYDIVYQAAGFQQYAEKKSGVLKAGIDKVAILTSGQWRLISLFEEWIDNGQSMSGEYIEECMQDNSYTFSLGGSGSYTTGAKKCDSTEKAIEPLSWSFNTDQTKLNTLGISWDLVSMNNTTFKIRRIYDDGEGLMVTQTLTFSK